MSKKAKKKHLQQKVEEQPLIAPETGRTWPYTIGLILMMALAFILRTSGQWSKVLVQGHIVFREVDPWYHMRLVDAMMFHLPLYLKYDMYAGYPLGAHVGYFPLLQWLVVIPAKVLHINYEYIGAILPPVLGTLTLIPIYLLCKEIFNRKVGLLACFILAILPGEFFHRSLLGFTDHHVIEVFLMTCTVYLLIVMRRRNSWLFAALGGIFAALFLMNWQGGSFLTIIVGFWYWLEFLLLQRKGERTLSLSLKVSLVGLLAFALSFPVVKGSITSYTGIIGSFGLFALPLVLEALRFILRTRENFIFALSLLIPIALVTLDMLYQRWNLPITVYRSFSSIFISGTTYIQETQPISLNIMLATYGVSFFLASLGLFFGIKRKEVPWLFIVWAVVMLLATIAQRRWSYYGAVTVAVLAAYFVFLIPKWTTSSTKKLAMAVVVVFIIFSVLTNTLRLMNLPNTITYDWYNACTWLRLNSQDPYNNMRGIDGTEFYYNTGNAQPRPAYGVLTWWDYGHWVIRIGHRIPTDSPTHTDITSSKIFTMQSDQGVLDYLHSQPNYDYRYIIFDKEVVEGKWYAVVTRAMLPVAQARELLPNSFAYRLWNGQTDLYTKVFEVGDIKIFMQDYNKTGCIMGER